MNEYTRVLQRIGATIDQLVLQQKTKSMDAFPMGEYRTPINYFDMDMDNVRGYASTMTLGEAMNLFLII